MHITLLLAMLQVAGDLGSTAAKNVSQTFKSVSSKAMENEKVQMALCCAADLGPALHDPAGGHLLTIHC